MTLEMVDRLFWRAGFGPSQADRTTWTGKTVGEAVDWLLDTPQGAPIGPQATLNSQPHRPARGHDRTRARLGGPDGLRPQPARRTADVLLAPPLGVLARQRRSPVHGEAERSVSALRRSRRESDRGLPEPGVRGERGPGDAPVPQRRIEPPWPAERELRPRADGALLPRRHRHVRQPELHGDRRARARPGALRLDDRHDRPEQPAWRVQRLAVRQPLEELPREHRQLSALARPSTSCSLAPACKPHRAKALVGVHRRAARRRDACRSHRHVHGQRAPDQAAAEEDPHTPSALRLARGADADQASDRLSGRRLSPGRSQRHQHAARTRGWRRWGRCRSSHPTSRAGSTASRS